MTNITGGLVRIEGRTNITQYATEDRYVMRTICAAMAVQGSGGSGSGRLASTQTSGGYPGLAERNGIK